MPLPLSYPGLRCVLEHLEAVKRARIIGRSPVLQKVDKTIPFYLDNLHIKRHKLTINNLSIEYDKDEVKFKMNEKTISRKGLESREDTINKLVHFYICRRSITRVDKLDWGYSLLPDRVMPVDLKLSINSLDAFSREDFDTVLPFIVPHSFPLKTVVAIPETSIFDNQIVKSAETLIVNLCPLILYFINVQMATVEDLKKLKNKTVIFQNLWVMRNDIILLIKHQMETKKATGTTFVITTDDKGFIKKMLREFEQAFGESRCDLDDVNERFLPGSSRFSISINNESRIHVYAIEDPEEDGAYKIIVKPVPEIS
ncbi:hypothetical protein GCK72_007905 [Caenorhabditis remanei]|uniref:DUF38 domain-containing protein n=1 Tax=Caenorhabditis remanei TaxID=31234 RepID=A0A6A5HK98_CAERE|nr:hypothetical protein GCK72_007905 [Caenorhabditis remanei]KAF1767945.1 hypothetical protein GCK72_007905 [Caenorhabditis remanei]